MIIIPVSLPTYGNLGCWKLSYPHCMWYLPQHNIDLNLDIPPVCTRQPDHGSAFCAEHAACASSLGYSKDLRGFLKDCGVAGILLIFYFLNSGLANSVYNFCLDTDQFIFLNLWTSKFRSIPL